MNRTVIAALAAAGIGMGLAGAAAADPTATVSGGYTQIKASNLGGVKFDDWGIGGAVQAPVAPHWNLQGDAAYDTLNATGVSGHSATVSGAAFWAGAHGRLGATLGYNEFGASGSAAHFTTYGAFGVFYAGERLTLGVKGGGLSGSGISSAYGGGEIIGYATPNVAISGTIDSLNDNHLSFTSYGARAEVLPAPATPISLFGGYTYQSIGPIHFNIYSVGLKLYFGGPKDATLVERHRTGVETWGTARPNLKLLF